MAADGVTPGYVQQLIDAFEKRGAASLVRTADAPPVTSEMLVQISDVSDCLLVIAPRLFVIAPPPTHSSLR